MRQPLSHDGLSPAADSAKAAAEAATDALAAGDFSQNMLISSYGKHFRTKGEKALSEEMKEKRLVPVDYAAHYGEEFLDETAN